MNVADRCRYISGDMFKEVTSADAYIMKLILHDWNDGECVKILSNIYNGSTDGGRFFIVEHLMPDHYTPFSQLFDIPMMCWWSGRGGQLRNILLYSNNPDGTMFRPFTQKMD